MVRTARRAAKAPAEDMAKFLAHVPDENVFWPRDGRVFHNLQDLAEGLQTMSDETYRHHVNDTKNDFCNWVRDVIGDGRLVQDLMKARSASQAARVVSERISYLKKLAR